MYFLTPMCFICLKSKNKLYCVNQELLTKLLYCLEKNEDFLSSISNRIKICTDCLDKLDVVFYFKKMCLRNVVQFNDYIDQLERRFYKDNIFNIIKVKLVDLKRTEIKDEPVDRNFKEYSDEQFGSIYIKDEFSEDINYANTECEEQISNEELKLSLHKEEILEEVSDELQSQTKKNLEQIDFQTQRPSEFENKEGKIGKQLSFSCLICKKQFNSKYNLAQHTLVHQKNNLTSQMIEYLCPVCGRRSLLNAHKLNSNNERPRSCSVCEKNFAKRSTFVAPTTLENTNKCQYPCSICGKYFKLKTDLKKHQLIHTNERPYACSICTRRFTQKVALNRHMVVHNEQRPYSCSKCNIWFTRTCDLIRHKSLHANEQPHLSLTAGKSFTEKDALMHRTLIVQNNAQPYSCSACGELFTAEDDLKQHALIHSNIVQLHDCPICGKSFTRKPHLKRHMRAHNNDRHFCSECDKSYTQKNKLMQHVLAVHRNERPHSCSTCGKCFVKSTDLKYHLLIHANERPYLCSICGKGFTQNLILKRHELTHYERSHFCPTCGLGFTRSVDLKTHMVLHTEERPYLCSICGESFCLKKYLHRHIESRHAR